MSKNTAIVLEKHFDTAFSAPNGVGKLRELILTLAMQGKLVKQDTNDPPASELLKEIEREKQWLVKAGKIKKPKPLPSVEPDKVPYELPRGWEWVRLGVLTAFAFGKTPASKNPVYWSEGEGNYWVAISDLPERGRLTTTVKRITRRAVDDIFRSDPVPAGSLLMSFKLSIGKVAITEIPVYHNEAIISFFKLKKELKMYLYWLLEPITRTGDKKSAIKGSTLNSTSLNNLLVPLPPLPEQQRIVNRIDQLMARCDALEKLRSERDEKRLAIHAAAITQLLNTPLSKTQPLSSRARGASHCNVLDSVLRGNGDEVRRGDGVSVSAWSFIERHFGELYSVKDNVTELRKAILELGVMGRLVSQDPNDAPASALLEEIEAEKQRLVEAGNIKKSKPLSEVSDEEVTHEIPSSWRWVRFGDIAQHNSGKALDTGRNTGEPRNYITTSNLYWGRFELDDVRQMLIRDEELEKCTAKKNDLLICEGGEAGRAAVWHFDSEMCFQNHIHRVRFYKDINPYFAYRFFEKLSATGEINQYRKGVGISNMSSKALASIAFPLPPLAEQYRIVARIDELMALCDALDEQISAATEKQTELLNAVMVAF